MFGRAAATSPVSNPQSSLRVSVMPEEFYGGKDPVLHYETEQINIGSTGGIGKTPPAVPKSVVSAGPEAVKKSKVLPITLASVAFLVAVGGITWYYLKEPLRNRTPEQQPVVVPPTQKPEETPVVVPTSTEPIVATSTPVDTVPTTTVSLAPSSINFSQKIFTDSSDLDADSMTDVEEEVYGIDSGVYDTDEDGYYDGMELFNLYNPRGVAPQRLVDSGLIAEYTNPTWQYRVYFPYSWESAAVDPASDQVLFSAITSDYVEIRVVKKEVGESFAAWFARNAFGEMYTDLSPLRNRFGIDGWKRDDDAVAYFETTDTVFVLLYHAADSTGTASFRQTFRMMMQSFRPTRAFSDIPEQTVLPQESAPI